MTERSYGHIFAQWLPLALSWVMMSIASPIVNAGISRLPNAAINLAAYGLTMDIAVLVESPIIMVLSASVALIQGRASYEMMRRFVTHLSIALTVLGLLVYYTPLYDGLFLTVMGVPVEVAEAAHPALRLMLFWPMAIGWRRLYQGILISHGRARLVSYGTVCRLAALIMMTALGVGLGWPGAIVGGAALAVSVIVEAVVIIVWALPLVRTKVLSAANPLTHQPSDPPQSPRWRREGGAERGSETSPSPQPPLPERERGSATPDTRRPAPVMTFRQLYSFYLPLAATDMMRVLTRPVSVAGIARSAESTLSLAAWSPALGLSGLLSSGAMALQEIVLAYIRDRVSYRRLTIFALSVGGGLSALQALLTFTPLADWYFRVTLGLPAEVEAWAVPMAQILTPLPLIMAARNLGRAILIARRQSGRVQWAMLANLVALIIVLIAGVRQGTIVGGVLAAWATVASHVLEVALLLGWVWSEARGAGQGVAEEMPALQTAGRR